MFNQLAFLAITTALLVPAAQADIIITMDPTNGVISGNPGDTVGWGFTITPDPTNFASIDSIQLAFDTNPSLGIFTDLLGPQGGPNQGVIAPSPAGPWTESFDATAGLGLGSYQISSLAGFGQQDTGTLAVFYDLFSADPSTCSSCYIQTNEVDLSFSVTSSVTSVPEPAPALLLMAGLASLCLARRWFISSHITCKHT
jgi:hypothetical protein